MWSIVLAERDRARLDHFSNILLVLPLHDPGLDLLIRLTHRLRFWWRTLLWFVRHICISKSKRSFPYVGQRNGAMSVYGFIRPGFKGTFLAKSLPSILRKPLLAPRRPFGLISTFRPSQVFPNWSLNDGGL